MNIQLRALRGALAVTLCLAVVSCGGGGGKSGVAAPTQPAAGANVAAVIVDGGPTASSPTVNELFTTVTLCVPGSTTQCATIDHVQVDTASFGFRVLAAALPAGFTLPVQAAPGNSLASLVECTVFGDGYSWGPVTAADFTIGGEKVSAMPLQLIGDARFPTAPTACTSQTTQGEEDSIATFGANAIIGIGVEPSDCPACAQTALRPIWCRIRS
jgi:hypothetical protein